MALGSRICGASRFCAFFHDWCTVASLNRSIVSRFFPSGFQRKAVMPDNTPDQQFVDAIAAASRRVEEHGYGYICTELVYQLCIYAWFERT